MIRLALNTSSDKIVKLIKNDCHLLLLNLIISVIDGEKNVSLSPKLWKTFQQGLIEAAVTISIFNKLYLFN